MKIALIGYGKMGKAIEKIALDQGHQVILGMSSSMHISEVKERLKHADVAIEFTKAEAAVNNLKTCFELNVPVVCGTTGWLQHWEDVVEDVVRKDATLFYAPNFSIGVYIFSLVNELLAKKMCAFDRYQPSIEEIHHTEKLDAPSGTAISLANQIADACHKYDGWSLEPEIKENTIPVKAIRLPDVPGTHTVKWDSDIDIIEIKHIAHNRLGFASGALKAAEWIAGKKGVFGMKDIFS